MATLSGRWLSFGVAAFVAVAALTVSSVEGAPHDGDPASLSRRQLLTEAPRTVLGPVRGFVANQGQWGEAGVAFLAERSGGVVALGADFARFALPGDDAVRMDFVGAAATARARGETATGARCHFLGAAAGRAAGGAGAVRDAQVYERVLQEGVYPSIDVRWRRSGPWFEYDLMLAPGADLTAVVCELRGVDGVRVDGASGDLCVRIGDRELRQSRPVSWWVDAAGHETAAACDFVVRGPRRFGFTCAEWPEHAASLVIDPQVDWSTFFGGSMVEDGFSVTETLSGDVVVAGTTRSPDLPTTPGTIQPGYGGTGTQPREIGDVCVARYDAAGQLRWATYLGGTNNDFLVAVEPAPDDEVVVCGWTTSTDWPTTAGAYDEVYNGTGNGTIYLGGDLFIARLSADGTVLRYSTFVGGDDLEYPSSMFVEPDGTVTLAGHVHSTNFPTTPGAWSRTMSRFSDAFVTRLTADGTALVFSTFWGGADGEEYVFGLGVDATGRTVFGGATDSIDLPVTPGVSGPVYQGGLLHFADGFLARLDPTGGTTEMCTYVGGIDSEHIRYLALEPSGDVTVGGICTGPNFPVTAGAFQTAHGGGSDAFVARLDPAGGMVWATYLGGTHDDAVNELVALGGGRVVAAGRAASPDFPITVGAEQSAHAGGADGFLAELSADGARLLQSTYIGGSSGDRIEGLAALRDGGVAVSGTTYSFNFPVTPGAADPTNNGGGDIFVARHPLLPRGCRRIGVGSGSCGGPVAAIGAVSGPNLGNAGFGLTSTRMPPGAIGAVLVASAATPVAVPALGIDVYVDLSAVLVAPAVVGSAHSGAELSLPVPSTPGLVGAAFYAQFVWGEPCGGALLASTGALELVVQP